MTTPETAQMPTPPSDEAARQRQEIEATRADMGRTLESLEDRVSPSRIKDRQTEKIRGRWQRAKESVMGSSDHGSAQDRVSGMADGAKDAVQHAPDRLEDATRGNPLAAGLIAVGIGALAGSLFRASEAERKLAHELRDEFEEPVRSELQSAGKEVGEHLREHAKESAEEVKSTAQEGAEKTKQDAQRSAENVQQQAKDVSGAGGGSASGADGPSTPGQRPQI